MYGKVDYAFIFCFTILSLSLAVLVGYVIYDADRAHELKEKELSVMTKAVDNGIPVTIINK